MVQLIAQCPACKARYKISDSKLIGPRLQCSKCRTPFRIKIPAAAAADQNVLEDVFVDDDGEDRVRDGDQEFDWVHEDFGEDLGEDIVPEFDVVEEYEEVEDGDDVDEYEEVEEYDGPSALPKRSTKKRKGVKRRRSKRAAHDEDGKGGDRSGGKSKTPVMVGAGLLVLLLLTGLFFLGRAAMTGNLFAAKKLETPEAYDQFVHMNWVFNCKYPSGWDVEEGGGRGGIPAWTRFESGSSMIRIKDCMSNQTVINIEKTAGGFSDQPPVANIHYLRRDELKDDYGGYKEKEAESIFTGYGDSRVSEFTAKTMFGSELHGFRATMIGDSIAHQMEVLCVCPEAHWQALEPAFRKVIQSMAQGRPIPEDQAQMFDDVEMDAGDAMGERDEFEEGGQFDEREEF